MDLLSQALLREYMHKKKFTATLKLFDEENPRNEKTISSRALMADLMHLQALLPEFKKKGVDTIMEVLCYYRLEKATRSVSTEELRAVVAAHEEKLEGLRKRAKELDTELGMTPTVAPTVLYVSPGGRGGPRTTPGASDSDLPSPSNSSSSAVSTPSASDAQRARTEAGEEGAEATSKKEKKSKKSKGTAGGGEEEDDGKTKKEKKGKKSKKGEDGDEGLPKVREMTIEELLEQGEGGGSSNSKKSGKKSKKDNKEGDDGGASAVDKKTKKSKKDSKEGSISDPSGAEPHHHKHKHHHKAEDDEEEEEDPNDFKAQLRAIKAGGVGSTSSSKPGAKGGVEDPSQDASPPRVKRQGGWTLDGVEDDDTPKKSTSSLSAPDPSPPRALAVNIPAGNGPLSGDAGKSLLTCFVGEDRRLPLIWTSHGFYFSDTVRYGLLQHGGGPCGVLAVVQAFILKDLFYSADASRSLNGLDEDQLRHALEDGSRQKESLRFAMANILTTIARKSKKPVTIVTSPPFGVLSQAPSVASTSSSSDANNPLAWWFGSVRNTLLWFSHAVVTETPPGKIGSALSSSLLDSWMEKDGTGLLCFTLSCLLTRGGPKEVASDLDVPTPMVVEHGYCTQELTNLCLCGKAFSNVHDNELDTGGGGGTTKGLSLRGFPNQLEVGFLTILEHQRYCVVGSHAKMPTVPIWVLYNESHYTVLFARSLSTSDVFAAQLVDVWYYDQMGHQHEEIRLTVRVDPSPLPPPVRKGIPTPYLNDILRTLCPQWATARIDWNGTEPLL